jgi:hypothetical protein
VKNVHAHDAYKALFAFDISRVGFHIVTELDSRVRFIHTPVCAPPTNHLLPAASVLLSEKQGRPLFEKEMAGSHVLLKTNFI